MNLVIVWLLLAGPLWAAIGGYLIPRLYPEKSGTDPRFRLGGMLGGFAGGPLAVGYLWRQKPRKITRTWLMGAGLVAVLITSQVIVRVDNPGIPVLIWVLLAGPVWAAVGAYYIPQRYRDLALDDSQTSMIGTLAGFAGGPLALSVLWYDTPKFNRNWTISLATLAAWQLYTIFALYNPANPCVQSPGHLTYLTQQTLNGLTIGTLYALMAVGLTLIYSVQGIVSFAHGQFYMIGGYFSYFLIQYASSALSDATGREIAINPIFAIPISGLIVFVIGAVFERFFLRPMHLGLIERVSEYAILVTFGFGFFMEYTTQAVVGASAAVKTSSFTTLRNITVTLSVNEGQLGPLRILASRVVAMAIGIALIYGLLYFLRRTWTGRALRAVSMDKQAAAVTGIDPLSMNTLAFALGAMLAGMAGAALVPVLSFVPQVGGVMAVRSYVVVVLGGLGSVPGALIGGLIVGIVEALGSGCYPDPSKGAAYKEAFALVIFALVLLVKPTGLFGREQL